ncbi:hypothetical protein BU25DRAFT_150593 [Macroventuria anomochaeta]|uniref:Uncharacterized protein n=1 Tax=Macroventuria anomochaeta TaxID=301207 RepID=A0ACB6SH25_9PLEO|nr:uncharacterized protein BU25DRAFT_150593 [Macroventuria anomochaeta]KAF2632392.1 hypothetical protein BU25DRAFT_150593 [Macroventuria anomochaeta]
MVAGTAGFLLWLQYVSRVHGPHLFMKAGSSTGQGNSNRRVLHSGADDNCNCCKPAVACLGPPKRASEKDGDGSRIPRRGGDKSSPHTTWLAPTRVVRRRSLEPFIGLRFGGCKRVQQFVPDDAASAAVLSTAQSHAWPLSALCGLVRVMTG